MVPRWSGMHDGTFLFVPVFPERNHCDVLPDTQPHPTSPPGSCLRRFGLSPRKCSMVAEPSTMCPAHDGVARNSKVRSEIAYCSAYASRFEVQFLVPLVPHVPFRGSNCERQP